MQRPKVVPNLASHLGFDWSSVQTAISDASQAWYAYNNPRPATPVPTAPFLGGSTGSLLLIGGGLILAYALLSKKR